MKKASSFTQLGWGAFAGLITVILWVLSMPPFEFAEGAYVMMVPLLLWFYANPRKKWVLWVSLVSGWVAWIAVLIWLRHVTYFGTIALSGVLSLFFVIWVLMASWVLPKIETQGVITRFIGFFALAGFWIVLEWVRSWLFWGFPWAPLSLSQWERPVVLQIAAWTGAYGVSFLLILFSLGVAQTVRKRLFVREQNTLFGFLSPDLYLSLGALCFCIYLFFGSLPGDREEATQELFTAGVVQPYILPELKWDQAKAHENLNILEQQTRMVGILDNDLLLWPEAATPWPILPYPGVRERVEAMATDLERPILMGNLAEDREAERWYNGAFLVEPKKGLYENFYVKRKLVPFGEFVPAWARFIEKIVPVGGDFTPGKDVGLLPLSTNGKVVQIGSLVCYEDIFPELARESVRAGADVLFVATNNAWYGEEGGAPQHAAHSVLRAVETRRPVMRVGNGGWSGWIDSYGTVREVITDGRDSVYFRGGGTYTVSQYKKFVRRQSYYVEHGDWFVMVSFALFALGVFWIRFFCRSEAVEKS